MDQLYVHRRTTFSAICLTCINRLSWLNIKFETILTLNRDFTCIHRTQFTETGYIKNQNFRAWETEGHWNYLKTKIDVNTSRMRQ